MPEVFSPAYFPPVFRWQLLKWYLALRKHAYMYLPLNSRSSCLQHLSGELKWSPPSFTQTGPSSALCLQDTSNSQQVKAEMMWTTRHLWLRGSCRCDIVSTDHCVEAVLDGVFTIIRQGKTEHPKPSMEPFLNSDCMPLSSHTQFTTWSLLHAHAQHLYRHETGQCMFQVLHCNKLFTLSLSSWQDGYRTDVRKHICIPCSPDLGNWCNNRSYKSDTSPSAWDTEHCQCWEMQQRWSQRTSSVQMNKNHFFSRKQKEFKN